ncbi:MAG TPA: hypothetical protein VGR36_11150 [Candidatus Acidoferrales bacterium]|nr:hypothetical protein [Candidatus Acidoferrales bacterium]
MRIGIALALVWLSSVVPADAHVKQAAKVQPGLYSRDAISVCSLPQAAAPIRIPSPDGKKLIIVTPDRDSEIPRSSLVVEAFGKQFRAGFAWSPDCEVAWSPDSRAFFATYTMGGAVGDFVTQVFFVRPNGLDFVEPTKDVVKDFMSRPRYCYWDEGPNLGSVAWLGDSSRLLIAAEFLPHSNCEQMGTFRAYEVTIPAGTIVRTYNQLSAKKLFWGHLGEELRGADDECVKKPKFCQAEAIKGGRTRFVK